MALNATRAKLLAAIEELHRLQMDATKEATFGGWTREAEAAYETRTARIAALYRELAALGGATE